MKRNLVIFVTVLVIAATETFAGVVDQQVAYVTGTITKVAPGVIGTLDTSANDRLVFRAASGTVEMPYASITGFEYHREVAHHIGVLPEIAVGLVKRRERQHFFTMTWKDAGGWPQTTVFEVSKHAPEGLLAILRARAPQACKVPADRMAICGVRR